MLAASGMASLIKVVLAMNHRVLPPTLNYAEPNPNIDFASSPFYVVCHEAQPWVPEGERPLRAAVNAFGFGGTNAHVILEEAPGTAADPPNGHPEGEPCLVVLNGRTREVLERLADRVAAYRRKEKAVPLSSLCHSLNLSQKPMAQKAAFVVRSNEELLSKLEAIRSGISAADIAGGRSNPNRETKWHLVFGDDFAWPDGWNERLSARFPAYSAALRKFREDLSARWPLERMDGEKRRQVGRLAVAVAIGNLFGDLGMTPASLAGTSIGALGAGILAGTLSSGQAVGMLLGTGELDTVLTGGVSGLSCFQGVPVHPPGDRERPEDPWTADKDVVIMLGRTGLARKRENVVQFGTEAVLDHDPVVSVLSVLAKCYAAGVSFNLARLAEGVRKVPLPTYPFEHGVFKAKRIGDFQVAPAGEADMRKQAELADVERLKRDLLLLGIPAGWEGDPA